MIPGFEIPESRLLITESRRVWWLARLTATKGHEQKFLKECEILARELGAETCHVFPSQVRAGKFITTTSSPGFPDLWCLWPGYLVVLELKRDRKTKGQKARYEVQQRWINGLQGIGAGVEAFFAYPEISEEVLTLLIDAATQSRRLTLLRNPVNEGEPNG